MVSCQRGNYPAVRVRHRQSPSDGVGRARTVFSNTGYVITDRFPRAVKTTTAYSNTGYGVTDHFRGGENEEY